MRGMAVGPVFGIIFALIALGMFLVFGFQQVVSIFSFGDDATLKKVVQDLTNRVDDVYNLAEGSSKIFTAVVPRGSKVCFLNVSKAADPAAFDNWKPDFETKYKLTHSEAPEFGSNLWIEHNDQNTGFKITHLVSKNNFCLVKTMDVYLTNMGTTVLVER